MARLFVRWLKFASTLFGPWGKAVSVVPLLVVVGIALFGTSEQRQQPNAVESLLAVASWHWWVIAALVGALVSVLIRAYTIVEKRTLGLRVFPDRIALNDGVGSLGEELADVERAWLMCPLATTFQAIDSDVLKKIDRAILTDIGKGIDFAPYTDMLTTGSKIFRPTLYNVTLRLQQAGKEVKWHRHLPLGVVIANPNSAKGWARMEVILPYVEAARRPSMTVHREDRPALFAAIVTMFEATWDKSNPPDLSELGNL